MKTKTLQLGRAFSAALLVLLLTVAGLTNANAQTFTVGNLNYSLNEDGVSVTVTGHVDGTAATGELLIPETVELYGMEYPVTIIGQNAFKNCANLTGSLVIPNSVVTISRYAFYGCIGITGSLVIPNSVVTIDYYAFYGCTGMRDSLTIGDSVLEIMNYAFCNCTGFTGSLVIPNSVKRIGEYAFNNCTGFVGTLVIPESITGFGYCPFGFCTGFEAVEFNAINYLNTYYNYYNPNSMYTGSSHWLYGCSNITTITIGENVQSIPANFLYGVTSITGDLVIPNSVTSIGSNAFYECTGFDGALTLSESLVSIGEKAFYNCSGFTGSLTIPNNVTTISPNAFSGCTGLSGTLTIGHSISEIGNTAFFGACQNFTSYVFLPDTPPTLGNNVFASANYAAPAGVHCGSLEAYQNTEGWSVFTNLQEFDPCLWAINAEIGDMAYGGTINGAGTYQQGQTCTLIATPNEGYSFKNWTEDGEVVSTDATYSFTVTSDRNIIAHFTYDYSVAIGLGGTTTHSSLPSYTWDNYSLTEQIYTAEEIGAVGEINKVAFYNTTTYSDAYYYTRNFDIYMVHTDKVKFNSSTYSGSTDWITVTEADKVFSGNVTMLYNDWTTITLDTPFAYNGSSNLALIVDDNTGSYYSPSMSFRSFNTNCPAAIYQHSGTNYNPYNPPQYSGYVTYDKNQVIFGFTSAPSYIVSATVNPAESGWVTGNGTYQPGESCTVTAIVNEGYAFLNWTENGEVVSTNAAYTFTVESGRNLVANFRSIATHWTPESSGYSDNMALTGVIQIDGVEQRNDALEVGVFCGNECRGAHWASYFPPTDRYVVMLTVYGNVGDNLTFKIYDHDSEQELDLISPSTVVFNTDGYGSPIVPYVLNFTSTVTIAATVTPAGAGTVTGAGEYFPGNTCTLRATANTGYRFKNWTLNGVEVSTNTTYTFTVSEASEYVANFEYAHTKALVSGWNWYSTYIELNGINGLQMLENSLGAAGVRIQGRNGYADQYEYQGTYSWYGTLNSINNEQMYKIRTNAACNTVMTGDAATAANHPITINSGWNWIGFPANHSVSVENAMSGFTPVANDVIKGRNGYTTYIDYSGYTMWYGTLNTLEPGQGYMYQSYGSTPRTLVFQTGGKGELAANITAENNVFVPNDTEFANNMTVTAVIDIEGEELRSDDYELAAFVGDECRGSVKLMYVEPIGRYVAFLTVFGENEDNISFVLTDGTETQWSATQMSFSNDATIGTLTEPATICFGTLGLNDNVLADAVVYPNPSSDVFNIRCEGITKIEVLNIYGQVVMSKEAGTDNLQIDLGGNAAGAYMLRIYTNNGMIIKNLVKSK
jgi:hypothetical protein